MFTGRAGLPAPARARRAYWTAQMGEAIAFMEAVAQYPVSECSEPMVSLRDAARSAGVEVAFGESAPAQGMRRLYYLREGLIGQFVGAAAEMNARGWALRVEDAYRTPEMQREKGLQPRVFNAILRKVQWECGSKRPPVELLCRRYAALVANAPKLGTHMSGSALDISVVRVGTGAEVSRGKPYLEMSEYTPMGCPFVSETARRNRAEITGLMGRHGFVAYPYEFWHYSDGDAYAALLGRTGLPARYGPVVTAGRGGAVEPAGNPAAPLVEPDVIRERMLAAIEKQNREDVI